MGSLLNILWLGLKEIRSLLSDMVMVAVRRLRVHPRDLRPGDRAPRARSTTRRSPSWTRTSRRCRRSCSTPSIRRASSSPSTIAAERGRGRDGPGAVHVRRRDPAALRARPPRRAQSGHPGEHRRDRHAAGRHRRRLHQEHHQRPHRVLPQAHRRESRRSPSSSSCASCSTRTAMSSWFKSVVAIINQITLLTVVLTGAAVIREREHGTLEHLLVMPLTAFEIAMAKVWANGLVILIATAASLFLIVQMALKVPFAGSHAAVVRRASCSTCSSRRRSASSWGRSRGRWRSSRC